MEVDKEALLLNAVVVAAVAVTMDHLLLDQSVQDKRSH